MAVTPRTIFGEVKFRICQRILCEKFSWKISAVVCKSFVRSAMPYGSHPQF